MLSIGEHTSDAGLLFPTKQWSRSRIDSSVCSKERLQDQPYSLPRAKAVKVVTSIHEGSTYKQIIKGGNVQGVGLIVMTSLGQSGNAQHLIGSVAEMYSKVIINRIDDKMNGIARLAQEFKNVMHIRGQG